MRRERDASVATSRVQVGHDGRAPAPTPGAPPRAARSATRGGATRVEARGEPAVRGRVERSGAPDGRARARATRPRRAAPAPSRPRRAAARTAGPTRAAPRRLGPRVARDRGERPHQAGRLGAQQRQPRRHRRAPRRPLREARLGRPHERQRRARRGRLDLGTHRLDLVPRRLGRRDRHLDERLRRAAGDVTVKRLRPACDPNRIVPYTTVPPRAGAQPGRRRPGRRGAARPRDPSRLSSHTSWARLLVEAQRARRGRRRRRGGPSRRATGETRSVSRGVANGSPAGPVQTSRTRSVSTVKSGGVTAERRLGGRESGGAGGGEREASAGEARRPARRLPRVEGVARRPARRPREQARGRLGLSVEARDEAGGEGHVERIDGRAASACGTPRASRGAWSANRATSSRVR